MGEFIADAWRGARACTLALKPCRVALLLVIGGLIFLLTGQGEDVARALAERRSGDSRAAWQTFWFFAATLAWSLSAWYWARAMLRLKLPGVPPQHPALQGVRTWTPRLLGFVAAASVALAFYRASLGYDPQEHSDVQALLRFYAGWSAAGAVAFLVAVTIRRWLFRLTAAKQETYGELGFRGLGRLTQMFLLLAVLVAVALFLVFAAAPLNAAPFIGSAAIVLIAAAGWIAAASTLDFIGMRLHVPAFSGVLALVIVFSLWNDNHAVRTLDGGQAASREDLRASLRTWLSHHQAKLRSPKARVPLYLVNAEGGGIRAAYWTVTVLGEIQKRHPAFAEHLYSLSGVSGGSLGASVFVALLAQAREEKQPLHLKETAQSILSEDFLSPVVATMLYPDLAQRFLPFPVAAFDRAATLEHAWERAWTKHVPARPRMGEPLDALWQPDGKHWTPVLLLNATWVETGKRVIASNLRVAADKGSEDFVDVEDANAFFAPRSLPLSTAAHMSARFTYVSPAGTLARDGRAHGRVVDGGYFENSAATATLEILQTIDLLRQEDPRWQRVDAYVIHISNEPFDEQHPSDALAIAPDNPRIAPKELLNEAMSPLWAMLNTRDARGYWSRESLAWQAGQSYTFHFGLCRSSRNVPLGWVLSASTTQRMEAQLTQVRCGGGAIFDNPGSLEKIGRHFGAAKKP
ncbi:MAG TPA: hypothetical protein VN675_08355 [Burkholderiales bacterium]|nr:hypothetical protein [Burkholderiales bacterium]